MRDYWQTFPLQVNLLSEILPTLQSGLRRFQYTITVLCLISKITVHLIAQRISDTVIQPLKAGTIYSPIFHHYSYASQTFDGLNHHAICNALECRKIPSRFIHKHIHFWPIKPFSQDYSLAYHTTHVVCVHFMHEWWDLQFNVDSERQIFETIFHGRNIYSELIAEEIFFIFHF